MLWTSQGMQMWTFEREAIPPSISDKTLTPLLSEFGAPVANFQGSCDFDAHFFNHQMIFNTDFCGSFAGETFQMHGCPMVSLPGIRRARVEHVLMNMVQATDKSWGSCNIFVANNPQAFVESYWEVNYLDVYEVVGASSVPPTGPAPPSAIPSLRDVISSAGAIWPASWTVPSPYPRTTS